MNFDVSGKTALVTGANRGIGKAVLEALLEKGAAKVYAGVRSLEKAAPLVDTHGEKVVPIHIDYEDPMTISRAPEKTDDVELVVNNAGVLSVTSPLAGNALESIDHEMNINVKGLIRMAQAYAPVLKSNGGGAFVQLNSVASIKAFADFGTYSASKAASYSLTQSFREILQEQGTLTVSVHPGPIDTDMGEKAGFSDMASPVEEVSKAIINGLKEGSFHVFPDDMAREIFEVYKDFAEDIVEADLSV